MKKIIRLTESDLTRIVKRVIMEQEDFTKDIAKDLYSKLPKENFTTEDFIDYMKEKKAPMSIITDVLGHLKKMGFPFSMVSNKNKENVNITKKRKKLKNIKMVTRDELNDYLIECECDIFMDGPFRSSDEEWGIFGKMFLKRIKDNFNIEVEFNDDWYENIWNTIPSQINDDVVEIGLQTLADWINEYNIEYDLNNYEDGYEDDEEKIVYPSDPSEWYFGVSMRKNKNDKWDKTSVGLNIDPDFFDTEIDRGNLPKNILKIIDDCGFDPERDEDGFWELKPEYNHLSKKELESCLQSKGLKRSNETF